MIRSVLAGACLSAIAPALLLAQDVPPPSQPPAPIVRSITISGTKEISTQALQNSLGVKVGEPLADPPQQLAQRVERQYRDEGYTFARVSAEFDAASGSLSLTVDEGVIGGVEFLGIDEKLVPRLADEFALRAGDVFNKRRAQEALEVLLRPTRGAIRPDTAHARTFHDSGDLSGHRGTFDLVDRNGDRILLVRLREPAGRFRIVPDLGEREDWFSSVDGFVPSLGMGIAVFDHDRFNHTFVSGHLSYKTASHRGGYALGFERPLFGRTKVFVGGELHDLTASDDQWQVSPLEASLAAVGPGKSYRDYYRRRGVQIQGAVRINPRIEAIVAWHGERQEPLAIESDFSLWNSDDSFRPNLVAQDGRLNAVIVGASFDGRGFERESLESSYRRHQLETPFGARLDNPDWHTDRSAIWRIDWTSEISGAFGGDFDFRRHIVTGRARALMSEHQNLGLRVIRGWSGGILPPQRLFAIGGIGSVHGYEFKEAIGDALTLMNLEYELGWRGGLKAIGFFDAGRVPGAPWLKGVGWGVGVGDFRIDFGYRTDAIPSSFQVLLRFDRTF